MRTFAALALTFAACAALAQGPGSGELRTSPPPPPEREPVLPGESPALKVPPVPGSAAPADNRAQRTERCRELSGTPREQCLLEQQGSAAGATAVPEPRTAPPPQNPR